MREVGRGKEGGEKERGREGRGRDGEENGRNREAIVEVAVFYSLSEKGCK